MSNLQLNRRKPIRLPFSTAPKAPARLNQVEQTDCGMSVSGAISSKPITTEIGDPESPKLTFAIFVPVSVVAGRGNQNTSVRDATSFTAHLIVSDQT